MWPATPLIDRLILGLATCLVILTAVVAIAPDIAPAAINVRADVALVTAAFLGSGAVAALEWSRGRIDGDGGAMLRGAAFAALATVNGLNLGVVLLDMEAAVGASLEDPGQAPVVVTTLGRGIAAAILVVAGLPGIRRRVIGPAGVAVLIVPAFAIVALGALAVAGEGRFPGLVDGAALDAIRADPTAVLSPDAAPLLMAVQTVIGAAFIFAAAVAYRSFRASGRAGEGLLACGLVVAAFSQVHSSIHPGAYAGLLTTADLLRLGFYAILLTAIVVDRRDDLRALREANVELRRLANVELATAALEERARLAREIHDGLAQDLWYAKLKHSRLAQRADFVGETLQLSREVEGAIDAALAEAQHAVAAMRQGSDAGSIADALARHVDDFADRFAVRAEFTVEGQAPDVGPRVRAEVLRIVQEALTNARRHADATVVRVTLVAGVDLRITIADNGRGFRPEDATPGFGLESMRQRANLIGAVLSVASESQGGTRVELALPREHMSGGGGP